jgi:uncharacterized protein YdbL (DUF1318 family)
MSRRIKLILAAGIAVAAIAGTATVAVAMMQDASASLRATGKVGEQADGYLGIVGSADASLRSQVDAVNIKRRAYYTDLAGKRGAKIEEVAAATPARSSPPASARPNIIARRQLAKARGTRQCRARHIRLSRLLRWKSLTPRSSSRAPGAGREADDYTAGDDLPFAEDGEPLSVARPDT